MVVVIIVIVSIVILLFIGAVMGVLIAINRRKSEMLDIRNKINKIKQSLNH
jgi:hypothetical protein